MNFKKMSTDAGAFLNRAIQKTEEKFGNVEKTEFGTHMELLLKESEKTREWSEKLVQHLEVLVDPNLASRLQSKVFDSSKATRTNEYDSLAEVMVDAGKDLQSTNQNTFGDALTMCGSTEKKIADAQRSLTQTTINCLINPLKTFLDGEVRAIQKEVGVLEDKRLDYDSFRNKVKKSPDSDLMGSELESCKSSYERQFQVVKHLLIGVTSTHSHHKKCLEEFFIAQRNYHDLCHQHTSRLVLELQKL